MSWKIRHEGSPQFAETTREQILQGLLDGLWDPTDEVMGPEDSDWVALENHPEFAELAADLEPPRPRHYDDETRLDMNPLIDVCLVLLIFFMLTTTYANLQKVMEAASAASRPGTRPTIKPEEARETMVFVQVRRVGEQVEILVEKDRVEMQDLVAKIRQHRSGQKRKMLLLTGWMEGKTVHQDRKVKHKTVVAIMDAARKAGIDEVALLK